MNSTESCGRSLLSNAAVKRPSRSPVIIHMAADLHKHCAPGGIRTPNLLIRSQMLYPLSYGRLFSCPHRSPGASPDPRVRRYSIVRPTRWVPPISPHPGGPECSAEAEGFEPSVPLTST